jgi:hypothetical protein
MGQRTLNTYASVGQRTQAVAAPKKVAPALLPNRAGQTVKPPSPAGIINSAMNKRRR